jgi:hypothetical protein
VRLFIQRFDRQHLAQQLDRWRKLSAPGLERGEFAEEIQVRRLNGLAARDRPVFIPIAG